MRAPPDRSTLLAALEARGPVGKPDAHGNRRVQCFYPQKHENGDADFSCDVHLERGYVCRVCGAKGGLWKLAKELRLTGNRNGNQTCRSTLAISAFAAAKRLPVEFLAKHGLVQDGHGLRITYKLADGSLTPRQRRRTALVAGDGSSWLRCGHCPGCQTSPPACTAGLVPYGLWRLDKARQEGELTLTEGETDALTLWLHDVPALGLPGADMAKLLQAGHLVDIQVLRIIQEPDQGGKTFRAGLVRRLRELRYAGEVFVLYMPDGLKDVNDLHRANPRGFMTRWLCDVIPVAEPVDLAAVDQPTKPEPDATARDESGPRPAPPGPIRTTTLAQVHALFRKHYGERYDTVAIDAVITTAATMHLTGDPVWLLVIGGPGGLKTETVTAPRLMPGASATSTITSVGALLSGTAQKQRAKDATGGLLKRIGNPGLLLLKDVSSILSLNRDARAQILAALREVYDGAWIREVGTDGGRTIPWEGRVVVIGAVTTAWDHHASVISAMGDRFVLVRLNTNDPDTRTEAGRRSMANAGHEGEIRQEVAEEVAALLGMAPIEPPPLSVDEKDRLLAMANFVTQARTAVETDYRGDVITAHAFEMPTRFLKQLLQLVRGGRRVGMAADRAIALALRCAVDSIPPLRLQVCLDLLAEGRSKAGQVAGRLGEAPATTERVLSALASLRVVHREIVPEPSPFKGRDLDVSYYSLRPEHEAVIRQIARAFSYRKSWRRQRRREGSIRRIAAKITS